MGAWSCYCWVGEEDRDAGGADVLTEKRSFKSNSTLFIPVRKKNVCGGFVHATRRAASVFLMWNKVRAGHLCLGWLLNKQRSSTRGIKMCKVMQPNHKASKMHNIYWMKSFSFFPLKVDSLLEPDFCARFFLIRKRQTVPTVHKRCKAVFKARRLYIRKMKKQRVNASGPHVDFTTWHRHRCVLGHST